MQINPFLHFQEKRRGLKERTDTGLISGDTAEMPVIPNTFLEDYGFRVIEDITYVSSIERINLEEEGGTKWNG